MKHRFLYGILLCSFLSCQKNSDSGLQPPFKTYNTVSYKDFDPDLKISLADNTSYRLDVDGDSVPDIEFYYYYYQTPIPVHFDINAGLYVKGLNGLQFSDRYKGPCMNPAYQSPYINRKEQLISNATLSYRQSSNMINCIGFPQMACLGFVKEKNGTAYLGWVRLFLPYSNSIQVDAYATLWSIGDSIRMGDH